jgi:hypothetical protein
MSTRILTLQQRAREIGRIRLGMKVDGGRPTSLDHFRFTSASAEFVQWCAATYGGEVQQWKSPAGDAWEVLTEASEIEVAIPSWSDPVFQAYELWSAGGCQRRCDGITEQLSGESCLCNHEKRECKPTTRLSLVLPACPIMGVIRLETHGIIAAQEIPGIVDGVATARDAGVNLRATLRLERKKSGSKEYVVPALEVRASLDAIESGSIAAQIEAPARAQIEAPAETGETINQTQARRLFALARDVHGDSGEDILKSLLGGRSSKEVLVSEYEGLIAELEAK